jgi:hypothetical protein
MDDTTRRRLLGFVNISAWVTLLSSYASTAWAALLFTLLVILRAETGIWSMLFHSIKNIFWFHK